MKITIRVCRLPTIVAAGFLMESKCALPLRIISIPLKNANNHNKILQNLHKFYFNPETNFE